MKWLKTKCAKPQCGKVQPFLAGNHFLSCQTSPFMGHSEAAELFHQFLHRLASSRDAPGLHDKGLRWVDDFLEKNFSATFWGYFFRELKFCQNLKCIDGLFSGLSADKFEKKFEDIFQQGESECN